MPSTIKIHIGGNNKGILYKHDLRSNNVRGSFIGIQFKQERNNNNNNNLFRCPNDVKEIEYLKKQVAELQNLLKVKEDNEISPKKTKSKITKKDSKIEIVEQPTSCISNDDLTNVFESLNDLL